MGLLGPIVWRARASTIGHTGARRVSSTLGRRMARTVVEVSIGNHVANACSAPTRARSAVTRRFAPDALAVHEDTLTDSPDLSVPLFCPSIS